MVVDYSLGKIYKITVPGFGDYVGSTVQKFLANRRSGHVRTSRQKPTVPLYAAVTSLETGWEGIQITLLQPFPCTSKDGLLACKRF
jgi:hypothetical protein